MRSSGIRVNAKMKSCGIQCKEQIMWDHVGSLRLGHYFILPFILLLLKTHGIKFLKDCNLLNLGQKGPRLTLKRCFNAFLKLDH